MGRDGSQAAVTPTRAPKHVLPFDDTRSAKRSRLSAPTSSRRDVRDSYTASHQSLPPRPPPRIGQRSRDDEQALLDDLMAGLDASMFDYAPSSPIVSQKTPSQQQSIRQSGIMDLENLGVREKKIRLEKSAISPMKPKLSPLKREVLSPVKNILHTPKAQKENTYDAPTTIKHNVTMAPLADLFDSNEQERKPDLDDELFEFDFDLTDIAGLDDQALLNPPHAIKYPILHPPVPSPPVGYTPTPWIRCKVKLVLAGLHFSNGIIPDITSISPLMDGSVIFGKTLVVKLWNTEIYHIVHLKERWADTPFQKGDIVNIVSTQVGSEGGSMPIVISFKDPSSYIIHHPDLMLTMTSIANAMPCPRKPILQSLVKIAGPSSKAMLYGTILHGLLQGALSEQDFSMEETQRRLDEDLRKDERRLEVWGTGLAVEDVRLEVGRKAAEGFQTFGNKWVGATPKDDGDLHSQSGEKPSLLAITGLHDIEEDIWSPKWGLKGKVDASVQASIRRSDQAECVESVAPLEIKTGRAIGVMSHRAQTMLYTLLMEDRYGLPIPAGLLYYSQLDSVLRVEARPNEIRALIMARNDLAHHLAKQRSLDDEPLFAVSSQGSIGEGGVDSFLPPTIDSARECKNCYAVDTCMLYRKMVDKVPPPEDDEIADLYEEKTGHLDGKDIAFFNKWETLLTVEEQDMGRFRSQLWTMTATQREKSGRCFSDMVISSYSNDKGASLAKIHRHSYTFARTPAATQRSRANLLSGHIAKGDPVNISIEPDLLCLSRGFVLDLTPTTITVGVTYLIDTEALLARTAHRGHAFDGDKVVFRIDKDEMTGGLMKMRANLASLFFEKGAVHLRRLVVQQESPHFDLSQHPTPNEIPAHFNADQRKAMEAVMSTQDYSLILGMPGTGKTTTIAEIIKALVERGKTVLLTSYTHSAVDTILSKLVGASFGILRLGNVDKVHPDVQHMTLDTAPSTSMEALENRLMSPPVVAATCLSVDHPLFFRRKFDYCIVDEASQITLPTCLGPLRMADRFVLVGDHFQLPPIVRNADARRGGLDISLFKLLSETHPEAVTDLSFQYRMNEDIMLLSNRLIYEGRLKCGSEQVAKRGLKLEQKSCAEIWLGSCQRTCWVQDLMDQRVKAVFVDTDQVPGLDSRVGDLVQNETEAKLVFQMAEAMTQSGLNQTDLAVITPYRQQIKLLTGMFTSLPKVEILTADKSQGRDKECILISLVRSNENGYIGDLLKDWRRINVSFTRAKSKLVIFGSRRTLEGDPLLKDFLELMSGKDWIYRLPKGADMLHETKEVKEVQEACSSPVESSQSNTQSTPGKARKKDLGGGKKGRREKKVVQGNGLLTGWLSSKPITKDILADTS